MKLFKTSEEQPLFEDATPMGTSFVDIPQTSHGPCKRSPPLTIPVHTLPSHTSVVVADHALNDQRPSCCLHDHGSVVDLLGTLDTERRRFFRASFRQVRYHKEPPSTRLQRSSPTPAATPGRSLPSVMLAPRPVSSGGCGAQRTRGKPCHRPMTQCSHRTCTLSWLVPASSRLLASKSASTISAAPSMMCLSISMLTCSTKRERHSLIFL